VLSGSYRTINLLKGQVRSAVGHPRVHDAGIQRCEPFSCAVAAIPLCDAGMRFEGRIHGDFYTGH
jgi:hypothetical protein